MDPWEELKEERLTRMRGKEIVVEMETTKDRSISLLFIIICSILNTFRVNNKTS